MAKRVAFLTPLLTWTVLLAAQWPASVRGTDFCGPHVDPEPYCLPTDSIRSDLWQANIDCSVPDTISVLIEDLDGNRPSFAYTELLLEARVHCTNGNAQAEMSVNCSIGGPGRSHTIGNLSTSGIQPGWTCSLSGCFQIEGPDIDNGRTYGRTPTSSCTLALPIEDTTYEPTTTSTEADSTPPPATTAGSTEAEVTMPTRTDDSTTTVTVPGTDVTEPPVLSTPDLTLIPSVLVPVIGLLLLSITVVLLMILAISCMKQQKARKTALLVLDRQNMIFDPDYTPGICIDKPSYQTHRTSVISNIYYLQFLTEKPCQFPADFHESNFTTDSSFTHDLSMSNSKQQNSTAGITEDTMICSEEFPGSNTSDYVLSGHSNGFTSPQQMDSTEDEFQSPSDSTSELTLSCGGCQSSGYSGNTQLDNSSLAHDVSVADLETLSGDNLSILIPENDPIEEDAGAISLDRCSHPSSSSAGYVEQSNTSNQPLTRDADNVFELDLELTHKEYDSYVQSQHPIANSITNDSHQISAGYIIDLQSTHQLHANLQDAEVTHLDNLDCSVSNSKSDVQSTHTALESRDQPSPLDMPHLTNTDGYVLNEHPTSAALTITQNSESQELSIALDCENTMEEGEKEPSHDLYSSLVDGCSLDTPCNPDKNSSQGYVTTEDIDMTEFPSREIIVCSNQVSDSPSQIEPGFTVHLDFDNCQDQGKDEVGYICNSGYSGIKTDHNRDMKHHSWSVVCLQNTSNQTIESNRYVTSQLNQPTSIPGTDQREQYVSYDFSSMASELRDSHSTSVTPEPVHNSDLGLMHIHYHPKSNYYPASDMSSGYLSGSSVSGDTSVYLGMGKTLTT